MRIWLGMTAVVGLLGASMAACSGTAAPPYPDVASFCAAKAQAECAVAPTCAISPATCKDVRTQVCTAEANQALADGTRHYNTDNAVTCINKVSSIYTANTTRIPYATLYGLGSLDDICERVFQGSAANNSSCSSNYDCTNNEICSPVTPGSAQNVCAAAVQVTVNGFCANPGSVCAAGSYCAATPGSAAECQAGAQSGQSCVASDACGPSLRCSSAGLCVAQAGPGEACAQDSDCSSTAPYCDPYASNICTVGLTFATGADDCSAFTQVSTPIPDAGSPIGDAATGG